MCYLCRLCCLTQRARGMCGSEERFFRTTESTHRRAQWCSVGQVLVMLLVTAGNLIYLQRYFAAKKLV